MTFYELEKICKKRRLKKIIITFLSVIILVLLCIIIYSFFEKNYTNVSYKKSIQLQKNNMKKTKTLTLKHKKENNTSISNSFSKQNKHKKTVKNLREKKLSKQPVVLIPLMPEITLENKHPAVKSAIITHKKKIIKTMPKKKQVVKKKNTAQKHLIEVETLPSYSNCIKLAEEYLHEKKYQKALEWAKNANIQNKVLPDSWIISAKALYYSGSKKKAVEILKIYLQYRKNEEIKKLLKEFENEKNN